ncbi:MAG: carbohydrate ABC transporter permease [Pleomorphochaeta sp.]|jgi:raffinose/stachyose/melibiose transport system permease protein
MHNKNGKMIFLFLLPVLILFTAFFIYPLTYVIVTSLTKWNGFTTPEFIKFGNYKYLFGDEYFRLSLRNNIVWAIVLGFIQVPMACIMAMILARRPKGWKVLRTVYFLPNVISQVALAMMWTAIYNAKNGVLNALLTFVGLGHLTNNWLGNMDTAFAAVIFQQVFYIGYFMIVILASRLSVPESYYEAAELDGASVLQQELHITLPMLKPILITTITLALAYGMRHFESTFLMTGGGPAHVTSVMGIMLYTDMQALRYGEGNAIGATLVIFGGATIGLIRHFLTKNSDN